MATFSFNMQCRTEKRMKTSRSFLASEEYKDFIAALHIGTIEAIAVRINKECLGIFSSFHTLSSKRIKGAYRFWAIIQLQWYMFQ